VLIKIILNKTCITMHAHKLMYCHLDAAILLDNCTFRCGKDL